jgi:hypothetical protein
MYNIDLQAGQRDIRSGQDAARHWKTTAEIPVPRVFIASPVSADDDMTIRPAAY